MNERIQQLAIAASGLATDEAVHLERVHNRAYTEAEWQDLYSQKFAQLIVGECANWVARDGRINWLTATQIAREMRDIMGVEK